MTHPRKSPNVRSLGDLIDSPIGSGTIARLDAEGAWITLNIAGYDSERHVPFKYIGITPQEYIFKQKVV